MKMIGFARNAALLAGTLVVCAVGFGQSQTASSIGNESVPLDSIAFRGFRTSPTVLTIGNESVTLSDFEHIFLKNNRDADITPEALDEYMELFINFKLKVLEAEALGMDTSATFLRELEGYRKQLARPYLTDTEVLDALVQEAFDRKQTEVRARHILISCAENALPADTASAYRRISALRERIANGADFESVARSKGGSDDPSAVENGGDLGWFTAFQMVYPFESAAYNTPVGELSPIIRTRYGYHILEVTGRRPARGEAHAAHIMIRTPEDKDPGAVVQARRRIEEIHRMLEDGADWNEMAMKYSEDVSSASKGGELPWFGTGKMVEAFEDAAFSLATDGAISSPFETEYGWHIVKRLEARGLPTYDESKRELEKKISRDSRAERTRASFLAKLKAEYGYVAYPKEISALVRAASRVDSVFYEGHPLAATGRADEALVAFAGQTWTVGDFVEHLNATKIRNADAGAQAVIESAFAAWSDQLLLDYEDTQLEAKHDDFRLLVEEYHDGILLFELTDDMVWSKAVRDTAGLEAFHASHSDRFMWGPRVDIGVYTCASDDVLKTVRKAVKKGRTSRDELLEANAKWLEENALALRMEFGVFEAGENHWADSVFAAAVAGPTVLEFPAGDGATVVVNVVAVREPEPKPLSDCRGTAIAAYQDELEARWIAELRAKFPAVVNQAALHSLAD